MLELVTTAITHILNLVVCVLLVFIYSDGIMCYFY